MQGVSIDNSTLHFFILSSVVEKGFAPSIADLCEHFSASRDEVVTGLTELAEYHGVVLHPKNFEVWVIHPFSLAPTNFWLENSGGGWWSNCAWCALGAAALIQADVTIKTTIGAEGRPARIRVFDGELVDKDYVIHFPVPMSKSWDNVIYTCSMMCLFQSEAQVENWCLRHNVGRGDVQPLEKMWRFARAWYGNHLDPDWKKWTASEARDLFREHGLEGATWEIPSAADRF